MNYTRRPAKSDFPSIWADFLLKKFAFYDIISTFSGRHLVVFFYYPPRAGVFFIKGLNMSIKEYTSMRTKDWVQTAGTLANIYAKLKGQQGASNGRDSTEHCDG